MCDTSLPDILILTHGTWGKALIESAEMIIGPVKQIYSFSLMPEQSISEYRESIVQFLNNVHEGSIIIADLFGGSTFNVAVVLCRKHKISAMSGLDITTIIEADELRKHYKGNELINAIIMKNKENYKNISELEINQINIHLRKKGLNSNE